MNTNETQTPLERELADMRSAFDKQLSVTLGQMQTIRELRADCDSWERQSREHAELAVNTGKQRDAWREDAMRLSIWARWYRSAGKKHTLLDVDLAAHDALVAKEGGK